jgi:hypothetical protein
MSMTMSTATGVLRVDDGRGTVIEAPRLVIEGMRELEARRVVITSAHCLPHLPPPISAAYPEEKTYRVLARLNDEPTVLAECLFVDPVADIAVLGEPNNQDAPDEADAFNELVQSTGVLPVANPQENELAAFLLSLDGHWFGCKVRRHHRWALWEILAEEPIVGGMSGSPIRMADGAAIGIVCLSDDDQPHTGGDNPNLAAHLPGWLIWKLLVADK